MQNEEKDIQDILKYSTLTCEKISDITGLSLYQAKKIRKEIIKSYFSDFPYSKGAQVRTDHFVRWYNCPRISKAYNELYGLN